MMERTPNIPFARPLLSDSSIIATIETLRSGWLGYGPRCIELEEVFRSKRGGWALATQSCTAALWAVAMITKAGDEPEVIMPANTFIACASAFQLAGWRVRLCDVDPRTGLLNLKVAHKLVTEATRAVLAVDTYGQRYPERSARAFCDEYNLHFIRDAAHRLNLDDEDPPLADFVCYSFGPTKEIASPDGGLIWSNEPSFEQLARAITFWGVSQDTWQRSAQRLHAPVDASCTLGLKLRMTDVSAAIILAQITDWRSQRKIRATLMGAYADALSSYSVTFLERGEDDSCLMALVLIEPSLRARTRERLAERGVSTSDHYPSLTTLLGGDHAPCVCAEAFCSSVIALPLHLHLTEPDVARIASALLEED